MPEKRQFATFHLDGMLFGLDSQAVQEVSREYPITPVPLAPPAVVGLMRFFRGQLLPVISLRRQLDLRERPETPETARIIVRTEDGPVCLLADSVGDVIEAGEELFERPPDTLRGVARSMIRGAYKLATVLLLELDIEKVVTVTEAEETGRTAETTESAAPR